MGGKRIHKVFIYGTLLGDDTGRSHWGGTVNVLSSRKATMQGRLFDNGYPYIVLGLDGTVHGKVFEIDDATLARFDEIEGIGRNWYSRGRGTALYEDGTSEEVWAYSMEMYTNGRTIENGQYRDWVDNGLYPIPEDKRQGSEGGE